ncbi:MAG: hypothetical protein GW903_02570 [Alphaproteobacteria bacterium]|nr:hypothetical protein [Alphaproteobacteria bacterium]NCQ87857.1 hypothetical protein [Alphaproteobacteria bacterium]NCT05635.1 hypothetical protein [Alphaproteobacteria bacterium]
MKNGLALSVLMLTALSLAACAKPDIHFQTQNVKLETPGADNAKCHLHNTDYRYVAYTGQTITMNRTVEDVTVTCYAEGNRMSQIMVPVEKYKMGYDAHLLPQVISVDFRGVPARPYPLPDYHNEYLGKYPLPTEVEYMGPATPSMGADEPFQPSGLLGKRQREDANPFADLNKISSPSYDASEEDK